MNHKERIGETIRVMRKSRGYTQKALADLIGQSASSITMYETGRREPELEVIEAIADIFNVPLTAIIGDDITDQDRIIIEAVHRNPRLGMLFDKQRKMSKEAIDFMFEFTERMSKERDND